MERNEEIIVPGHTTLTIDNWTIPDQFQNHLAVPCIKLHDIQNTLSPARRLWLDRITIGATTTLHVIKP